VIVRNLFLFHILEEFLQSPTFSIVLSIGLPYIAFIMLKYVSFCFSFFRALSWKDFGNCLKLCASIYMIVWFLPWFYLGMMLCLSVSVCQATLHSWNESNLIMMYDLCNVFLSLICKNSIEDICIYVHQRNHPEIFFLLLCSYLLLVSR
jgi:hypothetical protein